MRVFQAGCYEVDNFRTVISQRFVFSQAGKIFGLAGLVKGFASALRVFEISGREGC